jgi:hypothetical protein
MDQFPADIDPHAYNPRVPFNSAQERDFSEIKSAQEISRTLKFARDNGWPMLLSCASSLDGMNSITVAYETSLADCEDSIPWFLTKFNELMMNDGLIGLPAAARSSITWTRSCQIEDHRVHIFITEVGVSTPEDDGPPCYIFYTPRSSLKLRCESLEVAKRAVTMCYGQEPDLSDSEHVHHTKEWALIAEIFGGKADGKHRALLERKVETEEAAAWNKETFVAGLATQPYRSGIGKFTTQFRPGEPYSATLAVEKGVHGEFGTAVFFEQENRRCLLTRRLYGPLTDKDAFWHVMKDWAQFQPRLSKPRADQGLLCFPAEFTHVVEKYWDVLDDPSSHPDADPNAHYFNSMKSMTEALRLMTLSSWEPQPDSTAPDKSQRVARLAALSRRCPVQDAVDYWSSPEEQAQEECGTGQAGFAPAQDVHNVDT